MSTEQIGEGASAGAPSGWQMPRERRWVVRGLTILAVALLVGMVVAVGSFRLVTAAWNDCGDYEPPYGFGLLFVSTPVLTILSAGGFAVGALAVGRWSRMAGFAAGLSLATLTAVTFVAQEVPMYPAADYANGTHDDARATAACGPQGIPTWWPWWLPS